MTYDNPAQRRSGSVPTALAVFVLALLGAGCGSEPTTFDSLDPATQNLVLFESGWQCELTRFAVDDAGELEGIRTELQTGRGISDGAYSAFLGELAESDDLRRIVAESTAACMDGGEPVRL